jgi:glucose-6-phosphate isomerase
MNINHSYKHTAAFQSLTDSFEKIKHQHMREMFSADNDRFQEMHVQLENMLFDYSKNRISKNVIEQLCAMTTEMQLQEWINAMFNGSPINATENRPVLHTALRNFSTNPVEVNGIDVMPQIKKALQKMQLFSDEIINGGRRGYTDKQFTDIVNIGIGGSDLGPVMVCEALKHYKVKHINVHFVSNVDGTHIAETLNKINPETTLFLIASKTFTTQETMANALSARAWFIAHAGDAAHVAKHFVALSTAEAEVIKFGIAKENMFEFWDWVGGRYSLWSSIGLSICLAVGYQNFEQLLKGAYRMDMHFRETPFEKNIPVLMGLIG